jgi:hypothetical protein
MRTHGDFILDDIADLLSSEQPNAYETSSVRIHANSAILCIGAPAIRLLPKLNAIYGDESLRKQQDDAQRKARDAGLDEDPRYYKADWGFRDAVGRTIKALEKIQRSKLEAAP